jgi:HAD domain family 1 in Swiss Army Knife RNA repair proteins
MASYTTTALGRWSCITKKLPGTSWRPPSGVWIANIAQLHLRSNSSTSTISITPVRFTRKARQLELTGLVFFTPLPNPKLWTPQTVGFLSSEDYFANGGWWHDNHILEATGEGVQKEESRAWSGWWNEHIVSQ